MDEWLRHSIFIKTKEFFSKLLILVEFFFAWFLYKYPCVAAVFAAKQGP
jgi:hypothetical protein